MVERLYVLALSLHERGQSDHAVSLYREILSIDPEHAGALHLLGVCTLEAGNPEEGVELIGRALITQPAYPEALFDLGRAYLALGLTENAAQSFERAAELALDYASPRQALGLLNMERGCPELALKWFSHAQEVAPNDACLWLHTAWALKYLDRTEDAVVACTKSLELEPKNVQVRLELAEFLIDCGRLDEAAMELEVARELEPGSVWGAYLCGRAALARMDIPAAGENFRRCIAMDPEDSYGAVAQLVLLGVVPTPERSPLAWVRRLYEGQAKLWDQSIRSEQGYQGPELLAKALGEVLGDRSGLTVLDAGCGSGLCGPMLRPLACRLDGVDISPAMLELACNKGLYDRLNSCEITEFLDGCRDEYDLILAAAVFIYLGELGPVFSAAFKALKPNGLLAFTLFPREGESYDLTLAAYYRHGLKYVLSRAEQAGFDIVVSIEGVHEYRNNEPVVGLALVLRKPEK